MLGLMNAPTKEQVSQALRITLAVTEAIREAGRDGIPSGTLYATLAGRVDLVGYEKMLGLIKGAGLVEETPGHLLRWIGPVIAKGAR